MPTTSNSADLALNMEPNIAQALSKLLAKVAHDLLGSLLDDASVNIFTRADRPMDRAGNYVMGFRFDPKSFDLQFRAALRAKGLKL